MRGREFLRVAEFLKELKTEGSLRTQVSRFYYAAYLESRAYCERIMGYNRTRSSAEHAENPRLFQSVDPEVTASLAFLRELRNTADYDMDVSLETVALQFSMHSCVPSQSLPASMPWQSPKSTPDTTPRHPWPIAAHCRERRGSTI